MMLCDKSNQSNGEMEVTDVAMSDKDEVAGQDRVINEDNDLEPCRTSKGRFFIEPGDGSSYTDLLDSIFINGVSILFEFLLALT